MIKLFVTRLNPHYVVFICRKSAENAIQTLNGTVIGKQTVRLSWGRTPGNKQVEYFLCIVSRLFMIVNVYKGQYFLLNLD